VEDETADRVYVPGTNPTPPARDVEPFWPPEELEAPVHGGKPVPHDAPPSIPVPGVYRPEDRGPVPPPAASRPVSAPRVAARPVPSASAPQGAGRPVPSTSAPVTGANGAASPVSGRPGPDAAAAGPDSPWAQPPQRPQAAEAYEDVDIRELGSRNRVRPAGGADAPVTSEHAAYYPTVSPRPTSAEREQAGGTVYRPGPVPPPPPQPEPAHPATTAPAGPAPGPATPVDAQGRQTSGAVTPVRRPDEPASADRALRSVPTGHTAGPAAPVSGPTAPIPGRATQGTGPAAPRSGSAPQTQRPAAPTAGPPTAAAGPSTPAAAPTTPAAGPAASGSGPATPGAVPPNPAVPPDQRPGSGAPARHQPPAPYPPAADPRSARPHPYAHQQPPAPEAGPTRPPPNPYQTKNATPTAEEFARRRLAKPPEPVATMGARAIVTKGTMGLVRLAPGKREQEYKQDVEMVRRNFGGLRQVTIVNPKGGAGKTVAVLLLAMTFGQKRGGYVLAWDNNETQGTLGMRAQQDFHARTVRDMMRDLHLFRGSHGRVGDLSQYVRAQGEGMFDVLASDESATAGEMLTASAFAEIREIVSRFYKLIFVDTGNNVRAQNWQAAMDATDQLVITMSARNDSAETAARMLDHLEQSGRPRLVRQAVSVVSMPPTRKDIDLPAIQRHFAARTRAVLLAPYEKLIDSGEPLRYGQLSSQTRDAWMKIAAAVAEGL
jgi:MinD-like ATPase involved in chromosome partitioning or flagellar assembly